MRKMPALKWLLLTLTLLVAPSDLKWTQDSTGPIGLYIKADQTYTKPDNETLGIFCYEGQEHNIAALFKTVRFRVKPRVSGRKFEVFRGDNETDIENQYQQSLSLLHFLPWVTDKVKVHVFNKSCIGVVSNEEVIVSLEVITIDYWRVLKLFGGIILFFIAPKLSRNVIFYYTSGISVGLLASLLIVVFLISRLIPKKFGAVSVMVGGWAVVLYVLQMFWGNAYRILQTHRGWVLSYLVSVGLFSFAVCYYYGPVKNDRTHRLIQWALQFLALLIIFFSTEWQEVAMVIILIMMAINIFPSAWVAKIHLFWRRKFPPKLKFLTEDEYHEQGVASTRKALEELRGYCSSPDCKSWTLVNRLKSPLRFAKFVEGNSHLTDEEVLGYETELTFAQTNDVEMTDDSESDPE